MPSIRDADVLREYNVESVRAGLLVAHPDRVRVSDLAAIRLSMRWNGWFGVVVAQRTTRRILVGAGRWEAWRSLGGHRVPVQWLDCTDAQAKAILVADNNVQDRGTYDWERVAAIVSELGAEYAEAIGTTVHEAQKKKLPRLRLRVAGPTGAPVLDIAVSAGAVEALRVAAEEWVRVTGSATGFVESLLAGRA